MILIISTCEERLSETEFVEPMVNIVKNKCPDCKCDVQHYTQIRNPEKYSKIIICGTALKDFAFVNHLKKFSWLKTIDKPVLGICAGMQIMGMVFGAKLVPSVEMGMTFITLVKENALFSSDVEAYSLHSCSLKKLDTFDVLATSDKSVQAIQHKTKPFYGLLFHPEVRNKEVVEQFVEIKSLSQ